jgi:hypothetical protein
VTYSRKERWFTIRDELICSKGHFIECLFHLHPSCSVLNHSRFFEIKSDGIKIALEVDEKWQQREIINGAEDPPLGWYSPHFNDIKKSSTLRLVKSIVASESFCSIFYIL